MYTYLNGIFGGCLAPYVYLAAILKYSLLPSLPDVNSGLTYANPF